MILTLGAISAIIRAFYSPTEIEILLSLFATSGSIFSCIKGWFPAKEKYEEVKKIIRDEDWSKGRFESLLQPTVVIDNPLGRKVIIEIRKIGFGHADSYPWEFLPDSSDIIIKRPMNGNIGEFGPIEVRIRKS